MKKLTALAVLVTVISSASFASGPLGENSKFKVISKADTKYELIYVSTEQSDVRVTIFDEDGRNIESNTVKDVTKFRRTFDFSKLEAGKYSVVVKNSEGTSREEIEHTPNKMRLQTFVTKIPDSKLLKLHVGDFNKAKPVMVKIYDVDDRMVHKDVINNDQAFSKVYNMKKASTGEYRVLIENDGDFKSFIHKIVE